MYVNCVVGPLVALQASRGSGHRLVVLGADDDDNEVLFLRQEKITTGSKLLQLSNFFMQQVDSCRTTWVARCENNFLSWQITRFKLLLFHFIYMKEFHRHFLVFFFLPHSGIAPWSQSCLCFWTAARKCRSETSKAASQFNPVQKTHKFFIHFNCVKPVNRTSWQITCNNF